MLDRPSGAIAEWTETNPDRWQAENQRAAFEGRLKAASERAERAGLKHQFEDYMKYVESNSAAVICTSVPRLTRWVKPNPLDPDSYGGYQSHYKRLRFRDGSVSVASYWDVARRRADAVLAPYYEDQICFAALSLDGTGCNAYGLCAVKLKTSNVESRSTCFWENSVSFLRRRRFSLFDRLPQGYLTTFEDRGKLAAIKALQQNLLRQSLQPQDMQKILLWHTDSTIRADFVEVRVFGDLKATDISAVYFHADSTSHDNELEDLKRLLDRNGISWGQNL